MAFSEIYDQLFLYGGVSTDIDPSLWTLSLAVGHWKQIHDGVYDAPLPRWCASGIFDEKTASVMAFGGRRQSSGSYELSSDWWHIELHGDLLCEGGKEPDAAGCADCPVGKYRSPGNATCNQCPANTDTDQPGSTECLPQLGPFVQDLSTPVLTVVRDNSSGYIRVALKAEALPQRFVGVEQESEPWYAVDMAPNSTNLQSNTTCTPKWHQNLNDGQQVVTADLLFSDFEDVCALSTNNSGDEVSLDGYVGVFLMLHRAETVSPSVLASFILPIQMKFTREAVARYDQFVATSQHQIASQTFNVGAFHSSVAFFDKDYTTPYDPAIYITGDVAFVEHRLIDTDTFKMRIVHAWVSGSRDSNYTDLSQNLTATMERRQSREGRARFFFEVKEQTCRQCYVHVLSRVEEDGRRLDVSAPAHAMEVAGFILQPGSEASDLLWPEGLPFVAVGVPFVVFLIWWWLGPKRDVLTGGSWCTCGISPFLCWECLDALSDVIELVLADAADDISFANDNGWIAWLLFASTTLSVTSFCLELVWLMCRSFCRSSEKDEQTPGCCVSMLKPFHLAFEDGMQIILYTWATVSKAEAEQPFQVALAGIFLSAVFFFQKVAEDAPQCRRPTTKSMTPPDSPPDSRSL